MTNSSFSKASKLSSILTGKSLNISASHLYLYLSSYDAFSCCLLGPMNLTMSVLRVSRWMYSKLSWQCSNMQAATSKRLKARPDSKVSLFWKISKAFHVLVFLVRRAFPQQASQLELLSLHPIHPGPKKAPLRQNKKALRWPRILKVFEG